MWRCPFPLPALLYVTVMLTILTYTYISRLRVRTAAGRRCGLSVHGTCGSSAYNVKGETMRRDCDVCHMSPAQLRERLTLAGNKPAKDASRESLFSAVVGARRKDVRSLPPYPT